MARGPVPAIVLLPYTRKLQKNGNGKISQFVPFETLAPQEKTSGEKTMLLYCLNTIRPLYLHATTFTIMIGWWLYTELKKSCRVKSIKQEIYEPMVFWEAKEPAFILVCTS